MKNEEFQELKKYYLSMPDCMISSYDKSDRRKMSMLYKEVKRINRNRRIESPNETLRRLCLI
jgi:hypothetical protein